MDLNSSLCATLQRKATPCPSVILERCKRYWNIPQPRASETAAFLRLLERELARTRRVRGTLLPRCGNEQTV